MKSRNIVELKGIIGRDAVVRTVGSNEVANFSVATEYSVRRRDSNEYDTETTWHDVVAWKGYGIADFSALKKGVMVSIIGRLRKRDYKDSQGVDKVIVEVLAGEVDVIARDTPKTASSSPRSGGDGSGWGAPASRSSFANPPQQDNPEEDDLPF